MAIENFTTYTEVDPNTRIAVTAPRCEGVGLQWNEDAYVYKDFGVDHFDALDVDVDLRVDSTSNQYGGTGPGFSNAVNDVAGWGTTGLQVRINNRGSNIAWVILGREWDQASDWYVGAINTIYYVTISRAAGNDTVYVYVYSDAARTNLLDTLSVAGFGTTKWRYCYGIASYNIGLVRAGNFWAENMDLKEVPPVTRRRAFSILGV